MLESFLKKSKKNSTCSAYLDGEYNIGFVCRCAVCIGSNRIENIIELNLTKNEESQFKKSVLAVDELIKKCKKLLV